MTYLLDTHTLIWAVTAPEKLSETAAAVIKNAQNDVIVSAITFWELSLKHSLGQLTLDGYTPADFVDAARDADVQLLDLTSSVAASYHQLTRSYHRDPFDRMLIWQAIQRRYCLVSKDRTMEKYRTEGLNLLW